MRGLDEDELFLLERAVKRADGISVPYVQGGPHWEALFDKLMRRGLATGYIDISPHTGAPARYLAPTPLGRIALRIERLIRSGGALKGAS